MRKGAQDEFLGPFCRHFAKKGKTDFVQNDEVSKMYKKLVDKRR